MATYATNADVSERLVGLYPTGFSTSTQPTSTRVTAWLDEAEDEVNNILKAVGLAAPYTASAPKKILGRLITDYAEGRVRRALAAAAGDGRNEDGMDLLTRYDNTLRDMQVRSDFWGDLLAGGSGGQRQLSSWVTDHPDGDSISAGDFKPTFTKGEVF